MQKIGLKRNWRVGLVGTGQIAPFHLQALQRLECIDVVGVYDRDTARADRFVQQHAAGHAFSSYDRLLEHVDVVHILTPPASHASLTLRALAAGCHVFVEKPLATTVAECDAIADAARAARREVGVDHSLLRDPFTMKMLESIREGHIGRVVSVHCLRSQDYPEYEGGPLPAHAREAAFPFADLGVHALYQIEELLGPIEKMQWAMRHQGSDYQLAFDEWQALVECRNGNAQLTLSWTARPLQDQLIVMGTEGTIRLDRFGMTVTTKRQGRLPEHPRRLANAMLEAAHTLVQVPANVVRVFSNRLRRYHGLQETVRAYYESLAAGRAVPVRPEDTRRVVLWMERVAKDAEAERARQWSDKRLANPAKTLVTGATGFIGGHLVDRLLTDGRAVRILARRQPPERWLQHPNVEIIYGDLGDPEAVDRAIRGVEVIYHVGGTVHGSSKQFWRGSVRGTENVVASAQRHGVRQLIHVSSLSVLSALTNREQPITEDWPLEPHAQRRGLYTQTKLVAEQIVTRAVKDHRLPAVIVRPGEVIGRGAPLFSPGIGIRRGRHLLILGDGQLAVPLIHVHDLVDALVACEKRQLTDGSILHLVDGTQVTQNELARRWMELKGETLTVHHIPRWFIYSLALLSSGLLACLGKSSPASLYRFRSALARRQFCGTRAASVLEWKPERGVWQGLRDTIQGALVSAHSMNQRANDVRGTEGALSVCSVEEQRIDSTKGITDERKGTRVTPSCDLTSTRH